MPRWTDRDDKVVMGRSLLARSPIKWRPGVPAPGRRAPRATASSNANDPRWFRKGQGPSGNPAMSKHSSLRSKNPFREPWNHVCQLVVHATRRPSANESGSRRIHLHVARPHQDEVTVLSGLAVRPHADRADVARSVPFEQAVVAVDAALGTETRASWSSRTAGASARA